jgi:hypothetical protein
MRKGATRTLIVTGLLTVACGKPDSPLPAITAPTPPVQDAPPTTTVSYIVGYTRDTAFRDLTDVRITIADGPMAGASTVTGESGRFTFSASAAGTVTIIATKDGFLDGRARATWQPVNRLSVIVDLKPVGPSLSLTPGTYELTVAADPSCQGIPTELLTRRYTATVTSVPPHDGTRYSVNGPVGFGLGIAGDRIGFTIDGPAIVETLPQFGNLWIAGTAPTAEPATSDGTTVTIPFHGSFEYCALKGPMGPHNNCYTTPPDQRIAYAQCISSNDRMIFTRR